MTDEEFMTQLINELPSMTEALRCCVRHSGLTDKQIYLEMKIDGGNWSRMMSGQANFPHDRLIDFMKICRNEIPLQWLARKCGFDLQLTKSSYEELLAAAKLENERLQQNLDSIITILKRASFPVE